MVRSSSRVMISRCSSVTTCASLTKIIRATTNLLSIARIKPVKMEASINGPLPGEWYASLLSTGRRGGSVIHFWHHPTLISILVMGRSLNKALDVQPVREDTYLTYLFGGKIAKVASKAGLMPVSYHMIQESGQC